MKSIYPIEPKDYSKEEYKKEILIRDLITNLKKDFSENNYEIIAEILESIPTQNLIGWMPEEYLEELNIETEEEAKEYFKNFSREDLIDWLCKNDRNGVYKDEDSIREFGEIMTKDVALKIAIGQYYG